MSSWSYRSTAEHTEALQSAESEPLHVPRTTCVFCAALCVVAGCVATYSATVAGLMNLDVILVLVNYCRLTLLHLLGSRNSPHTPCGCTLQLPLLLPAVKLLS